MQLKEVSASTRLVAFVLQDSEGLTAQDLQEQTSLSRTTVFRALDELRDRGLLEETIDSSDGRRTVYTADFEGSLSD
jgi:DNA-binding MarR family transcriptional regulator